MNQQFQRLLDQAYKAFNTRKIEAILPLMHTDVQWPNGWEGGYVHGHAEVSAYWTRQWKELDPIVQPLAFTENPDGKVTVSVHQTVKDLNGKILSDGTVTHIYTFEAGKIKRMDIKAPQ